METAWRYESATPSTAPGFTGFSFFKNTNTADDRNTNPQNVMNPFKPTLPYEFRTKNPVNDTKKPAV